MICLFYQSLCRPIEVALPTTDISERGLEVDLHDAHRAPLRPAVAGGLIAFFAHPAHQAKDIRLPGSYFRSLWN